MHAGFVFWEGKYYLSPLPVIQARIFDPMQIQELLKQTQELRQTMAKASELAEKLQKQVPEMEEPAMSAQCSVIRAFLQQVHNQEAVLSDMLKTRSSSNGQA